MIKKGINQFLSSLKAPTRTVVPLIINEVIWTIREIIRTILNVTFFNLISEIDLVLYLLYPRILMTCMELLDFFMYKSMRPKMEFFAGIFKGFLKLFMNL